MDNINICFFDLVKQKQTPGIVIYKRSDISRFCSSECLGRSAEFSHRAAVRILAHVKPAERKSQYLRGSFCQKRLSDSRRAGKQKCGSRFCAERIRPEHNLRLKISGHKCAHRMLLSQNLSGKNGLHFFYLSGQIFQEFRVFTPGLLLFFPAFTVRIPVRILAPHRVHIIQIPGKLIIAIDFFPVLKDVTDNLRRFIQNCLKNSVCCQACRVFFFRMHLRIYQQLAVHNAVHIGTLLLFQVFENSDAYVIINFTAFKQFLHPAYLVFFNSRLLRGPVSVKHARFKTVEKHIFSSRPSAIPLCLLLRVFKNVLQKAALCYFTHFLSSLTILIYFVRA